MIIEPLPIRTPCCQRLAMRTVTTVLHLGDGPSEKVAASLRQETVCPHCGSLVGRNQGQQVHGFHGRMQHYIFTGVPTLEQTQEQTTHGRQ